MADLPPLLEVDDLAATYRGLRGLDGVSLRVPAGGAVCRPCRPERSGEDDAALRAVPPACSAFTAAACRAERSGITASSSANGADPAGVVRSGIVQVLEGRRVFADLDRRGELALGRVRQAGQAAQCRAV